MTTRKPAVSGFFYPSDPHALELSVTSMLKDAKDSLMASPIVVAPHAGYIYSGPIAASAYTSMNTQHVKRAVVIGPSHRVPFSGIATPGCETFSTPLGDIPLDNAVLDSLEQHQEVEALPEAHAMEHSVEVHLPFLQVILEDFSLVPLVVGDIDTIVMADVISMLVAPETLIVVSSDLSHFLTYEDALKKDSVTSALIENKDEHLTGDRACGYRPLNGLLHYCETHQLNVSNIDLRNSGDTAGDKSRVVGYGAYAIH